MKNLFAIVSSEGMGVISKGGDELEIITQDFSTEPILMALKPGVIGE